MREKKGIITVEASIGITFFMFIVLMVLGMSRVYNAQSMISHATLQTSQSLAVDSFYRETVSGSKAVGTVEILVKFASALGWESAADMTQGYASLGKETTKYHHIVKCSFTIW